MSIIVTDQRVKPGEGPLKAFTSVRPPAKVLNSFLIYEIGYGGRVTVLTATKVVVVTNIMGCVDTTTYEGSEQDMALIVEAAGLSLLTHPMADGAPYAYREAAMDRVMSVTKGLPILIKMGADMVLGGLSVRALMVTMLGAYEQIPTLMAMPTKTLMSVLELVRIDGCNLEESIELALSEVKYDSLSGKAAGLVMPLAA